jgi:hypothetical protein
LRSEEIANYSLTRNPVVFANACSTGAKGYYGANSRNIAEAFVEAGAAAFIGPLWKTTDDISASFASLVYSHLKVGYTIGDALLRTKRELFAHPKREDIDWAAFSLFGNPDSRLYAAIPKKDVSIRQVQITMSNAPGTLGRILVALSRHNINIVQGRSITFDDEKAAGYIAEMEIPMEVGEADLRNKLLKSPAKDLIHSVRFVH